MRVHVPLHPFFPAPHLVAPVLLVLFGVACESEPDPEVPEEVAAAAPTEAAAAPERPAPAEPERAGPIPEPQAADRLANARQRLNETEAGALVWKAIEAHGGLEPWLQAGTIEFVFDYAPIGEPERRMYSRNRIDLWSARAWQQELGQEGDATLGWDGEKAWITPGRDAFPAPARFWALTPYYFVGVPFVMADPGTRFERLEDAALEGEPHHIVKVTYEEGTGDSPDDYYILYIHPDTHRIGAIRYVVAYPGFFPEGGHTPEKLMVYGDQREVEGLRVAHRYDTYAWDAEAGERGEKVTEVTASEVAFGETWPASLFAPPEGAEVIREIQTRQ